MAHLCEDFMCAPIPADLYNRRSNLSPDIDEETRTVLIRQKRFLEEDGNHILAYGVRDVTGKVQSIREGPELFLMSFAEAKSNDLHRSTQSIATGSKHERAVCRVG